mgnify:CR=1 FL=1
MRKGVAITVCSLVLLAATITAAPAPTKQDVARQHISALVEALGTDVIPEQARQPLSLASGSQGEPCVDVELELPDTVWAEGPDGWREHAQGYFELTNCGDEAAEIALSFELTVVMGDIIDTVVVVGDLSVWLRAGETVSEEFVFPVPPFDASYTVCVTASNESATDSDCETMIVVGSGIPGMPVEIAGYLEPGSDCLYFVPEAGVPATRFALENYGDFVAGDHVLVQGLLVYDCETECTEATGCIIDNSIILYGGPPPGFPFAACGLLVQGENCVLFAPHNDFAYSLMALDNYGGFGVGDTVFVEGLLMLDCETDCIGAIGCLTENTIDTCSATPPEIPVEGCGVLVQGSTCVLFAPAQPNPGIDGDHLFALDNYGPFSVGDSVFVAGLLDTDCVTDCPDADACITENIIDVCQPGPPPEWPIEGCGILIQGTECVLLDLFSFPDSLGGLFVVENQGSFGVGDTVFVAGMLIPDCPNICMEGDGCIVANIIEPCEPDPPSDFPFAGCGVLSQGTGCVLFTPAHWNHPGGGWVERFVLDNYGAFVPGDSVFVEGLVSLDCDPGCPEAIGCIVENSIWPCDSTPPPPPPFPINGCGVLVAGDGCMMIDMAMDTTLELLELDFWADFQAGDTVFIDGLLDPACTPECVEATACVYVGLIDYCTTPPPPPPGDTIAYDGCGVLMMSPYDSCLLYVDAIGEYPGIYTLDDYGIFGPGDSVCVGGDLILGPGPACPDAMGHIYWNTIGAYGELTVAPKQLQLRNYPNPFNPITTIAFELPEASHVTVTVYNLLGQQVKTLLDAHLSAGSHQVEWNGLDETGRPVSSGVYFYRFSADDFSETRKMLLMK